MWGEDNSVVVSKWKDRREVLTITNKHAVEMVLIKTSVGDERMKPNIIRDYNNGMPGVDGQIKCCLITQDYENLCNGIRRSALIMLKCLLKIRSTCTTRKIKTTCGYFNFVWHSSSSWLDKRSQWKFLNL